MNRSLKKIWNVISSILVALVVILALLLVGARVVGLQVFTVLSGSMEPTYYTGSLIYVKEVDPYTIEVGQPITFMLDENTVATHRVVGIVPDEEDPTVIRFRTKGDANETEDGGLVHYKNVIGTPIQKRAVVRNQNKALFARQIIAQQPPARRIQMVGRLVDQQKMVFVEKQRGQKDFCPFPMAERFKRPVQYFLLYPQQ